MNITLSVVGRYELWVCFVKKQCYWRRQTTWNKNNMICLTTGILGIVILIRYYLYPIKKE